MKKIAKPLLSGVALAVCLFAVSGCKSSSEGTPAQEAEFRNAMSKKGFDINQVPPKDRERVRALMQANSGARPPQPTSQTK